VLSRFIRYVKYCRDLSSTNSYIQDTLSQELKYWDLTDEQKATNYRKLWFGGQDEFVMERAANLHYKFDHALNMLCGSQRPPHWGRRPYTRDV
jgi:hypothetical protein